MLNNRRVLVGSVLRRSGSPRSAKVWLLIGQLGLGGTEKQVALLARGLRDRGVDTSVLVMFDGGPRERELRAAGVPVIYLGFARFSAARNSVRNVVAFARLVGQAPRGAGRTSCTHSCSTATSWPPRPHG